ncbi:MAG TPA: hypothetical protein VLC48_05990 [Gemmatimonadota bacterium]|nr:hypothetical protein [Gemmatimonadota bacterium]
MEVLVYFALALIVLASVYQLLISQNRLYVKQAGLQDVRGSLRTAANFLAFELRQTSASGGDIYTMGASGITLRSIQGAGIVCGIHGSAPRFGLYATSGTFDAGSEDSAIVFAAGNDGADDDQWMVSGIKDTWTTGGGVDSCDWPGSVGSEITVEMDSAATAGVYIGAPIRAFHRVEYGMYQEDGRWWLGRKIGSASSYDMLIGPLLSPSDSGLYLTYYDQAGNLTADSTQVAFVDVLLRGESLRKAPAAGGPEYQADTLTLRVALRG